MMFEIFVNIGLGNDLLPFTTKPLPEPALNNHQCGPVVITHEMLQMSITIICVGIQHVQDYAHVF